MSHSKDQVEPFLVLVTGAQRVLHAFILRMVPSLADADDILQQTNLVLWSKQSDFTPGTDFRAWAFRIARYQIMAYRKQRSFDRLVFNEELLDRLACRAEKDAASLDAKRELLLDCSQKLSDAQQRLLNDHYTDGLSGRQIAEKTGAKADAVFQALHRVRQSLMECIDRGLRRNSPDLFEGRRD
jgi:RNA polymerase sigma-70 factor (ECF subfamily)